LTFSKDYHKFVTCHNVIIRLSYDILLIGQQQNRTNAIKRCRRAFHQADKTHFRNTA